eukprot:CAMPEP_0172819810 /NCGR_PEP_ID=MMETSP1075-20121228/14845_1 /TAXON_ID=2916 /ORGANISM="Ceratium fusus, Strain PA161109" /LENGTH=1000 /DNA_ID=CAMNT_0013660399 /DNA_START=94 /DNA_END=3093 /DNA_ORIENTATION=-
MRSECDSPPTSIKSFMRCRGHLAAAGGTIAGEQRTDLSSDAVVPKATPEPRLRLNLLRAVAERQLADRANMDSRASTLSEQHWPKTPDSPTSPSRSTPVPRNLSRPGSAWRRRPEHPLPRLPVSARSSNRGVTERYGELCEGSGMLPKFARTVQRGFHGTELDITASGLGDLQLKALLNDKNLLNTDQITRWRLRDSRLTDVGIIDFVTAIRLTVEVIDISLNRLSMEGSRVLSERMRNDLCFLRVVDLSGNGISDEPARILARGLLCCSALLRLDMNSNTLRDGTELGNLCAGHTVLTRLSLRRNFLGGAGVAALFEGILQNAEAGFQLADVDVAWNGIGSFNGLAAGKAIGAVLRNSGTLYHCDLSYNSMDASTCAFIAEGLKDNHSLYGLHVVGNAVSMDPDGFLTPIYTGAPLADQAQDQSSWRFGDPTSNTMTMVGASKPPPVEPAANIELDGGYKKSATWSVDDDLRGRDMSERATGCWACEGWERVELQYPIDPEGPEPKAVWMYTNLDGFRKGVRMKKLENRFVAARMVPPCCKLQAIFQVDAAFRNLPGAKLEKPKTPTEITLKACPEFQDLRPPPGQNVVGQDDHGHPIIHVEEVSVVDNKSRISVPVAPANSGRRCVVLDPPDGTNGVPVVMLRVTETDFKLARKVERTRAFYADWKRESTSLLTQCMLNDFGRTRLSKLIDEDAVPAVKEVLEQNYRKFMAIYRRVSAVDISGETELGVTQLQAGEAMMEAKLAGDSLTKIADVDRFFIAAKVKDKEAKHEIVVVNDKSLVRYEFLELIVRVAHQRFLKGGFVNTMHEAINMAFECLEAQGKKQVSIMDNFLYSFHCDDVDDVYKKHMTTLQEVYKKHSGSLTKPGKPKSMALLEWQRLLEVLDVYDDGFQARHSAIAFRLGMMTQRDETGSSRFQEMTFLEFLHALGAVFFMRKDFSESTYALKMESCFVGRLKQARSNNLAPAAAVTTRASAGAPSPGADAIGESAATAAAAAAAA